MATMTPEQFAAYQEYVKSQTPAPQTPAAAPTPAPAQAPAGQPAPAVPPGHEGGQLEHDIIEQDGRAFCRGCGTKFVKAEGPADLIKSLNQDFHKAHDVMACKDCRPMLSKAFEEQGYEVDDKGIGGKMVIYPKDGK